MNKKYRLTTTLALLQQHGACTNGYRTLLKSLGADYPKDKPINMLRILKSNSVQDMCWCFRATREDSTIPRVLVAADFAQSVLKYFTARRPNDDRPKKAIQAARDFARGKITREQCRAAAAAADAAAAAAAADAAAAAAAYAAAAADAAAADAAAAYAAAAAAAAAAAREKERAKQAAIIRKWLK